MYGKWIVAKGSAEGERHVEDGTGCQDAYGFLYDPIAEHGIAIVCDGAGSANNSAIGAKFLVDGGLKIFKDILSVSGFRYLIGDDKSEIDSIFISAFRILYDELKDFAVERDLKLKSLAATIIVVLFGNNGIVCSHIGDGRAGYQDLNGNWYPLLEPYKGEEANQTVFVTSDIWDNPSEYIRTIVISNPCQSFTLMSDGCESACFELNRFNSDLQRYEKLNRPYNRFFDPNIATLRQLNSTGQTSAEIDLIWTAYLKNGNSIFESEVDDKTLILGTLHEITSNA